MTILEIKLVDKIGYPRAVYNDNGSHFKKLFASHLAEKEFKQNFAPITHYPERVICNASRNLGRKMAGRAGCQKACGKMIPVNI